MYGIYIIYYFLEINNHDDNSLNILIDQLNDEYLLLLTSLLNKNNKKLSFMILLILIDITYTDKGELLFGKEEKVICNIASFLGNNRNDINLLNLGIWLIKNITDKNSLVKSIFQNYNIIQFFNEIYDKYIFDKNFMENIIICIGHFANSRFCDNNIINSIKIIKSQLNTNLPIELLRRYFYVLYDLGYYNNQKVYEEMIKHEIHKDLMNIYLFISVNKKNEEKNNENKFIYIEEKNIKNDYYRDLRYIILQIFGKMLSSEHNEITQNILDIGFAKFLNNVFQSTDIKIIKYAFICLSNICSGTYGQINNLFENDTIYEALKISQYFYETLDSNNKLINSFINEDFIKAFKAINNFISLLIINSLYEKIFPYVRNHNYALVKILLKGLNIFTDNNINNKNKNLLIQILNSISKLNIYESDQDEEEIAMNNSIEFSEFLEKNGFKEILEKLSLNSDANIVDIADKIYNDLAYDDKNNNEDVNISDIVEEKNENNGENEENK